MSPTTPAPRRRWPRRLAVAVGVVIVLAVGIPFAYIHFVNGHAPSKLSLRSSSGGAGTTGVAHVDGTFRVDGGSLVGYRVNEKLLGQDTTAVGRTGAVSGSMTVAGTTVETATFTAQMGTVKSNEPRRDQQFDGRIMDTARYPTATFTLTRPIALGATPAEGRVRTYQATGGLTLRGQTRTVTFPISAEWTSSGVEAQGEVPVLFRRWDVPNPSFGSFVTTADHGTLEFLLKMATGSAGATPDTTATTAAPGGGPGGNGPVVVSPTTTPPLTLGS